jgi:hypothetical protein
VLHTINKYDQFKKLSKFCKKACQEDPSIILRADDFATVKQEYLIEFLTENKDSLKQIEVWDKLVEWAIAKSNGLLPSDVTMWTIDNVTIFGTLIQPFISLINFQRISRLDFLKKVKPFETIFDKKIIENNCILTDLKSPQILNNIDSQIINPRDASFICNWIKIMKKQSREITYDFDLLVRGSRDGFNKNTFHKRCDNKRPTITIARVKNSNEILGGFNPCNWKSVSGFGEFISTEESFIFSLDKNYLENSIFSKVIDTQFAIFNSKNRGPFFGHGNSDFELLYKENQGQCSKNGYEKAIRQNNEYFEIDDYEVFKVTYI